MKPIQLKLWLVQRLSLLTIALTFGAFSSFIVGAPKAAGITYGKNCNIPTPIGADTGLMDTIADLFVGLEVSPEQCTRATTQIAASVGRASSTTTTIQPTNQPTTSGTTTAAAPATDPNADSDGDGKPDATDNAPLIANLPYLSYGFIGKINISYNLAEINNNAQEEKAVTLGRESASTSEKTNTSTYTNQISASMSVSVKPFNLADSGVDASVGYSHTWENSYTNTAIQESRNKYEEVQGKTASQNKLIRGGTINTTVEIKNEGTAAISLRDFRVEARRRLGSGVNDFKVVTTLIPKGNEFKRDLAPGEKLTVTVEDEAIDNIAMIDDLLAAPDSLYFEVIRPELNLPATGTEAALQRSFANTLAEVRDKTVQINIDYGRGKAVSYHVTTGKGITFAKAMEILNLKYATNGENLTALCTSRGSGDCPANDLLKTDAVKGILWAGQFVPNVNRSERMAIAPGGKFEATELQAGDTIMLAFIEDQDKDGLSRNEEVRYKTPDSQADCNKIPGCKDPKDTDGDGLSDFEEVRVGWTLGTDSETLVFSSPLLADVDKDGWDDKTEKAKQTDPNSKDTDRDTIADSTDPDPLVKDKAAVASAVAAGPSTTPDVRYYENRNGLLDYMASQKFRAFGTSYLKGTATMSSSLEPVSVYGANRGIDGDLKGGSNFFHTKTSANEWWKLKLSNPQEIRYVVIWNRLDNANADVQRRAQDFELVLRDSNGTPIGAAIPLWERDNSIVKESPIMLVALPANVKAAAIEIKNKAGTTGTLNLSEVEVYGVPSTPYTSPATQMTGKWEGVLKCETDRKLTLDIKAESDTKISAVVSFSYGNISRSYKTVGTYIPWGDSDYLDLKGESWLANPNPAGFVNFGGTIKATNEATKFIGTDLDSSNCKSFDVTKVPN